MSQKKSLGDRWGAYQPTKTAWFWSSAGIAVATMVIGFTWGGWVTGGTARSMADDAAMNARAQLAAVACVDRFNAGPDAATRLVALKDASSYSRGDMITKAGLTTMARGADPVHGAADLCAQMLTSGSTKG